MSDHSEDWHIVDRQWSERYRADRERWEQDRTAAMLREDALRHALQEAETERNLLRRFAYRLLADVDAFARVFGFVVPANASKIKAILAGKSPRDWQDFRDPNKSTEVF